MEKNKKTPITINGVNYNFEDMKAEEQLMVNHIIDLDRKLNATNFTLDQLNVSKNAFVNMLTASLEAK